MKRRNNYIFTLLVLLGCVAASQERAGSSGISRVFHQADACERVLRPAEKDTADALGLRIGIISYWDLSSPAWDRVPPDSMVLINPESGILELNSDKVVSDSLKWVALFERLKKKHLKVLGYVPTGYFDHVSCKDKPNCATEARIRRQVATYYELMGALDGIFYDETSPKPEDEKTADYKKEYTLLRSINKKGRITVFNVGWASCKAVDATDKGEYLVLYESSAEGYADQKVSDVTHEARQRGIIVWHLLHSVGKTADMCSYVARMAQLGANYGYVTDVPEGELTWNSTPSYWGDELAAFLQPGKPCAKK